MIIQDSTKKIVVQTSAKFQKKKLLWIQKEIEVDPNKVMQWFTLMNQRDNWTVSSFTRLTVVVK